MLPKKSVKTSNIKLFINHLTKKEKQKGKWGTGQEKNKNKTGRSEHGVQGAIEIKNIFKI